MSKGTTTDNDFIKLVFLNAANDPVWRGNANLYVSLHTADPTAAGDQTTNETSYTNYTRMAVAKTVAGWTISGVQASNAGLIQFAVCGAVPGAAITYVAVGLLPAGAGQILYSGILAVPLVIATLVQPQFSIGSLIITES